MGHVWELEFRTRYVAENEWVLLSPLSLCRWSGELAVSLVSPLCTEVVKAIQPCPENLVTIQCSNSVLSMVVMSHMKLLST